MDYENFGIMDFMLDEYFQEWVLAPTLEADSFWQGWLKENPEKKAITEQARQAILNIRFEEYLPQEAQKTRVWNKINQLKNTPDEVDARKMVVLPRHKERNAGGYRKQYLRFAAVVAVLFIAGLIYFLNFIPDKNVVQSTAYGKTKMVLLSDGSKVYLNANSKISYQAEWEAHEQRELWLEGEAYFSVTHQDNDQKFIVHTKGVQVEVLGTEFNVKDRNDVTNVVLLTGKVKIEARGLNDTAKYIMEPGELVRFAAENKEMVAEKVSPEDYVSWKDHQLKFNNTKIIEIAQIIEDNYGYQVVLDGASIKDLEFTGTVPSESVDYLLVALSESFQMQVSKKEGVIQFSYQED